jgi:hypothetical protein
MTYRGTVKQGVVVLEPGATFPEGTTVTVSAVDGDSVTPPAPQPNTLGRRLMKYAGAVKGLPSDMARNHDHYIHGTPRK